MEPDDIEALQEAFGEWVDAKKGLSDLSDSFRLKQVLTAAAAPNDGMARYGLPSYRGFLFVGERGNGKHTYAEALMQSICQSRQALTIYAAHFVRFTLADFADEADFAPGAVVDGYFQAAAAFDKDDTVFLIFDGMEHYVHGPLVMKAIANAFASCEQDNIFLICISEDVASVGRDLENALFLCSCELPNETARRNFFETALTWELKLGSGVNMEVRVRVQGLSAGELAGLTAGYSYGMLKQLTDTMKLQAAAVTPFEERTPLEISLAEDWFRSLLRPMRSAQQGVVLAAPQPQFATPAQAAEELAEQDVKNMNVDQKISYIHSV